MSEIKCPEEVITYGWINSKRPNCSVWSKNYKDALHFAKMEATPNEPQYIVERTEYYEIVGKVEHE